LLLELQVLKQLLLLVVAVEVAVRIMVQEVLVGAVT
jgi:hypothetical protein